MRELILGGVRSGKSRLAEQHANDSGLEVVKNFNNRKVTPLPNVRNREANSNGL